MTPNPKHTRSSYLSLSSTYSSLLAKLVFIVCLTLPFHVTAQTSIFATAYSLAENDTFTLRIESEQNSRVQPELSPLSESFRILDTKQLIVSSYVNGQRVYKHRWTLLLQSTKAGNVVLPALRIGEDQTTPLTFTVAPTSQPQLLNTPPAPEPAEQTQVFVQAELTDSEIYVNSQTTLTTRLFLPLSSDRAFVIAPPQMTGTLIQPLGQATSKITSYRNRPYQTVTQTWLISAFEAGANQLDTLSYLETSELSNQSNDEATPITTQLTHDDIRLSILDKPALAGDNYWIPTNNISLTDNLPHQFSINEGESILRTLTLEVHGVRANTLPPLSPIGIELTELNTPEVSLEEKLTPQGLVSRRIETLSIIPTEHGEITLPAINIAWWELASDTVKQQRLPAKIVRVTPVLTPSTELKQEPLLDDKPEATDNSLQAQPIPVEVTGDSSSQPTGLIWLAALAFLAAIGIIWIRQRATNTPTATPTKIDTPKLTEPELFHQFVHACQQNKCTNALEWLLKWGEKVWPDDVSSLADLSIIVDDTFASAAIMEANSQQNRADSANWQGDLLLQAMLDFREELLS